MPLLHLTDDFGRFAQSDTLDSVHRAVDDLLEAKTDVLAVDVADGDLTYYDSDVGVRWIGQPMDALYGAGVDVMAAIVERTRAAGQAVVASVRMNDHHGADETWTPWDRAHTQWSLGTEPESGARTWRQIGDMRHMDYAVREVRAHRLEVVDEFLSRYAFDGVQLDFGRSAPFVSEPGHEKAGHVTAFVEGVCERLDRAAKQRGARLQLGVVVPWDLDFCAAEGLDVTGWMRSGLVDWVAPGEWYYSDWNMPVDAWAEHAQGTSCKVLPLLMGNVTPEADWERGTSPLATDRYRLSEPQSRALIEASLGQGAHGVTFYNYYAPVFGDTYPHLRSWLDHQTLRSQTRHYLFSRRLDYKANEHDTYTTGEAFTRPTLVEEGGSISLTLRCHASPDDATLTLRFKAVAQAEDDKLSVALNGVALKPTAVSIESFDVGSDASVKAGVWEAQLVSPGYRTGVNELTITLTACDASRDVPIEIADTEIFAQPRGCCHARAIRYPALHD